ncbi:MAG: S41 family peptidase [Ruthenibacterium sp.]
MNKKISVNLALAIAIIAMTVTFSVTMILSQNLFDKTVSSVREKEIMYTKIAEIDKMVRADYYGEINNETLYDMMGAGYLQGIGDTNAKYYTAKKYLDYLNDQNGKVQGIGVDVIKDANGYARVIRVYTGSPAAEAGLTKNSYLTKIGDTDVRTLTAEQINVLLRGEAGTTVTITYIDANAQEQPALPIQRRQYDTPTVEATLPEGKTTGYLKILTFNQNTAKEVQTAVETMKASAQGVSALVLDVRNNNGGSLKAAVEVIDVLCPAGPIVSVVKKDSSTTLLGTSNIQEMDLPIVVITNKNTAAGAELLAESVREFGKGKIVGELTAGKGQYVSAPSALTDGSAVSYTIGSLLTKDGKSFDKEGFAPDIEASLKPEDEKNFYDLTIETDAQILKAFEVAELATPKKLGDANMLTATVSGSAPTASSSAPAPASSASAPSASAPA